MLGRIRNLLRGQQSERLDQRYGYAGQFFACYLHQDWPEESGTWEAAADLFLTKETPEHAQRAVADLGRLLAETHEESELQQALDAFGNAYDPTPEGLSLRAWLAQVRSRLARGRDSTAAV